MGWTLTVRWLGRDWDFEEVQASISEQWGLYADAIAPRSISVSVVWHDNTSIAEKVLALGHELDGAPAQLTLDGVVHLRGRVTSGRFGAAGHPCSLTVSEEPYNDGGQVPGEFEIGLVAIEDQVQTDAIERSLATHRHLAQYFPKINAAVDALEGAISWPNSPPEHHGRTYTMVFGAPGSTGEDRPATPAATIDNTGGSEKVLVCGHKVDTSAGSEVYIWGPSATAGAPFKREAFSVAIESDGFGRAVTTADISGATVLDLNDLGADFYAQWDSTAASELSGLAGDVLTTMLASSTLRVDWGRVYGVAAILNRYQLDGYVDDQVTPWEWIEDNLLSVLPIHPVAGSNGLYFALWDPDLPHVGTITDGVDFVAEPTLSYGRVSIANHITLKYGYNPDKDEYTRTAVAAPYNNPYCAISEHRYGLQSIVIESDMIERTDTAQRIIRDIARMRAFRPVLMTGTGSAEKFGRHKPGDLVQVTSTQFGITSRNAYVTAIERDGSDVLTIELAFVPDPFRN